MAIEIIKRGEDPAEKPIPATCTNCKTDITFLPSDAKRVPDQREGDYYEVICPVCPTKITVAVNRHGDH